MTSTFSTRGSLSVFSPFPLVSCLPNGEAFDSSVQSGFGGENRASIEDHRWHFVTREIHQGFYTPNPIHSYPFQFLLLGLLFSFQNFILAWFLHILLIPFSPLFFMGVLAVQFSVCDTVIWYRTQMGTN